MTLVDTNVLLDLVTNDSEWAVWSLARLEEAALLGPICINDIVYAELSIRYERIEDLDQAAFDGDLGRMRLVGAMGQRQQLGRAPTPASRREK